MPANRDAPLVAREALGGAYVLLTFRHPETAREARAGQFVMIKAGVSAEPPLRRPFSILSVDPEPGDLHAVREGGRPGLAGPVRDGARRGRAAASARWAGRSRRRPRATRRCWSPAGTASRPSASSARSCARTGGTARLFYGGRTRGRPAPPRPARRARARRSCRPPRTAASASAGRVTVPARGAPRRGAGAGAPLRLRPRRDAARGRAHRGRARARRRGEPRPLDGLRHRHLPRLRRPHAGEDEPRRKYRCACTEGPVFDAARVVWPGEEDSRARGAARGEEGRP